MIGLGNRFGEFMIGIGAMLGTAALSILVIATAVLFVETV